MNTKLTDVLDELVEDWESQIPELNPRPMLVVGRLLRISNLLQSQVTQVFKPYGLHYTDFDIMATLRRKGEPFELTPTQLSESVILTSGAMTAAIGRLEKASMVKRTQDKEDGRSRRVKLTAKGVRLVEETVSIRFELAAKNLEGLSPTEQKKLASLLKKMLSHLS